MSVNGGGGPYGRLDFESETFVVSTLDANFGRLQGCSGQDANHGHSHLVPVAFDCKASGRNGFSVGDISPTLRAMGHSNSHQNAGGQVAVAVALRGRDGGGTAELSDVPSALRASQGGGDKAHVLTILTRDVAGTITSNYGKQVDSSDTGLGPNVVSTDMAVRRLTPRECERLQGFKDDYTLIPYRKKLAADGPRYKALGNSMAVNCMRWIGERIDLVEAILGGRR